MIDGLPGLRAYVAIGAWLRRIPYWWFITFVTLLGLLHIGARLPWQPDAPFMGVATSWPSGSSWDSSIGWVLIPDRLGLTTPPWWTLAWWILLIITGLVVAVTARRRFQPTNARIFILGIAASAIPLTMLGRLGFYEDRTSTRLNSSHSSVSRMPSSA